MEITVIDPSGFTGWVAAASRTGEVYMTSVESMVTNVLNAIGQSLMTRLNILDHGSEYQIQIGTDIVAPANFKRYETTFRLLRGHFAQGGFVHLQHCKVGRNQRLLHMFAEAFGVPVVAATGKHNSLFRFNLGEYVRCSPQGTMESGIDRP